MQLVLAPAREHIPLVADLADPGEDLGSGHAVWNRPGHRARIGGRAP